MNILILNGCPKGKYSVTLQTSLFLQLKHPEHSFQILHVGQQIQALEKDFSAVEHALQWADLLIFSYPVYTFIAPSQLHRFIRLLKQNSSSLKGKYVTQITTSKHFYDVTAHRYIQDNCQDMEMKFLPGLSADMEDLTTEKGQKEALDFFDHICWQMQQGYFEPLPAPPTPPVHAPVTVPKKKQEVPAGQAGSAPVVIVTDCATEDKQLSAMIARFQAQLPLPCRVINLRDVSIQGGCLGCFRCAATGQCVYPDGFDKFLRSEIQTGCAIVYAFSILDHSMGPLFKMYDDRQFCNGHRTVTMGSPTGYLISGNYHQEFNLQTIVEARAQVGGNYLAGVASDESRTDEAIDYLAANLTFAIEHHYSEPQNFYGVGGMRIFRDLIYQMQGMMKADHKFFKAHGQYDFPQKKKMTILKMYFVGALMSSPKLMSKAGNRINEGMVAPYKKVLHAAAEEEEKGTQSSGSS